MVNIEIDGIPLKVDSTKMIIQAADEAGIDIPRFCYHKKLSIAANCRMCLVEVDKARKAMPACATPVVDGMKIFTQSPVAKAAQRSVMEFLLINHPLDCPICDQGGECELQDLSVGYGSGVSRFTEGKRVVKDKDIGPLIQTEMTRCIHCTRCVRFGQEIAGIKELGATGRGEHMEIGTYVEHSLASELSGNIIDLCPVGALTSKPFRYQARAWELMAHPSVAPHDSVGSNIELHVRQDKVVRVVPRDNEAVNESWLSDRDRFSYLGLNHPDRLLKPMIKADGKWDEVSWQTALDVVVDGLKSLIAKHGAEEVGGLISPNTTLEEAHLFQKWLRGLGVENIDHRLRQQDFDDDKVKDQLSDWSLAEIADNDAIFLVGTNIRTEQPILAHRVRQAALMGCSVSEINFVKNDLLMPVNQQLAVDAKAMANTLAGIAKALSVGKKDLDRAWTRLLPDTTPTAYEQNVALQLANASKGTLVVGALLQNHPEASKLRALTRVIADLSNCTLLMLPESNSVAHDIADTLPADGKFNTKQMLQNNLRGYVMMGLDPILDTAFPAQAEQALQKASLVIALSSFKDEALLEHADVLLPMSCFSETSGTFVGVNREWQQFSGAVASAGESRPGWKILRVLGNVSKLNGFDHVSSQDVVDELKTKLKLAHKKESVDFIPTSVAIDSELMLVSEVPMYRTDSLVRHSEALQKAPETEQLKAVRMNAHQMEKMGLSIQHPAVVQVGDKTIEVEIDLDNSVADGCVYLAATTPASVQLGTLFAQVKVSAVGEVS